MGGGGVLPGPHKGLCVCRVPGVRCQVSGVGCRWLGSRRPCAQPSGSGEWTPGRNWVCASAAGKRGLPEQRGLNAQESCSDAGGRFSEIGRPGGIGGCAFAAGKRGLPDAGRNGLLPRAYENRPDRNSEESHVGRFVTLPLRCGLSLRGYSPRSRSRHNSGTGKLS